MDEGPLELVLAEGAAQWGSRAVPWELWGELPADAEAICLGSSGGACFRWRETLEAGTWIAPAEPGEVFAFATLRLADGSRLGPFAAGIYVDALAPTAGTLAVTPAEGGLDLAWSGFSDVGSGIESYRLYLGEGVSAPRCDGSAEPDWEGTEETVELRGLAAEQHTLRLCAVDGLGHLSEPLLERATPLADPDPPEVSDFSISDGAEVVSSRDVRLSATVRDDGSDVWFCASDTAATVDDCLAWRPWSDGVEHELGPDEGEHVLQAWFRDRYHNTTGPQVDRVVVDRTPPQGGALSLAATAGTVELSWSGFTDAHSSVAEYVVVTDETWAPPRCTEGTEIYRGSATSLTVDSLEGGAWVGFRVCALDPQGHLSAGANDRVFVPEEGEPPAIESFVLNGGEPVAFQRRVDVAVSASDPSGVARMCMSTDPSLCYAWEAYATVADVLLPTEAGDYSVYLWVEDGQGVRSPTPASAAVTWRTPVDLDGDGTDERTDCDDSDPLRHPAATEVCDGIDNDCSGEVDGPDAVDAQDWYVDEDGDGYGDPATLNRTCDTPEDHILDGTDCNDRYALVRPDVSCTVPQNCQDLLEMGYTDDGLYEVAPTGDGSSATVACDQSTDGGGWTQLVAWSADRGDGLDELTGEGGPAVEEYNTMRTWELDGGLTWCAGEDGDSGLTAEAVALSVAVPVPNSGEVRMELDYYGHSMEDSAVWLTGEVGGEHEELWCQEWTRRSSWYASEGRLSAEERALQPLDCSQRTYDSGSGWTHAEVDLATTVQLTASVDTVHLRSVHYDTKCKDRSTLYALGLMVR